MESPVDELEKLFDQFKNSFPERRKQILSQVESKCIEIKGRSGDSYVSQKCTSLVVACKNLARLRQPKNYDESRDIVFALGDISIIKRNFNEPNF